MNMLTKKQSAKLREILWDAHRSGTEFYNTERKRQLSWVHAVINDRSAIKARMVAVAEEGRIAVIRNGMDCDCTQYRHVTHIDLPKSVVAWWKAEQEHEEWLDGPESVCFGKPSENPIEHKSRDRALEAFEDGHPHVVYWGDL